MDDAPKIKTRTKADPTCGTLRYTSPPSGNVTMPFTVSHPAGFATYSFTLLKGVGGTLVGN